MLDQSDHCGHVTTSPQVATPPFAADIFSVEQLLERLASLVALHPHISRWLFKLPEDIKGRGFGEPC